MKYTQSPAVALAERLCRPQRVGVFGHRGVGKTTLLTVLYREGVGGRLPGLRLAAADARTAEYLSDKVLQLEAGRPLPATLGETELRFHLYYQGARLDLLVMDYQGEHVALGREEPIRDFLRECDSVWLCLDVPVAGRAETCLRAQQEVEQLVEDYLGTQDPNVPHRPMALVLTKSDLLGAGREGQWQERVGDSFDMTLHALTSHCPHHGAFAVSSLGGEMPDVGQVSNLSGGGDRLETCPTESFRPQPSGLEGPLAWLAEGLRAQDEERLNRLWEMAPGDLTLLGRCVGSFARRYPDAPATRAFRERLRQARRQRLRRRVLGAVTGVLALLLGAWAYDALGEQRARAFASAHADDPAAVRQNWLSYGAWHPTRHALRPGKARAERLLLEGLDRQVREREREGRLAELRRRADDPDADPEGVWALFQRFHDDFPEHDVDADWRQFRARVKARSDSRRAEREAAEREARERRAKAALRELEEAETRSALPALVERADRFLRQYAGTMAEAEVARRRAAYLRRIDERDFESVRTYEARNPLNFYTRKQRYQEYLDRHPEGAYAARARSALRAVAEDWDRHDFRRVRDHYVSKPGEVKTLRALCRSYLSAHPEGKYRAKATELLRWVERVSAPGEYRVVLRSGSFDKGVAHLLSRGASLSVEIEVGGVRYGPSTIVKRSYTPQWDYEFPRRVRWQLGEPVRIWVTDHYWWRRPVAEFASEDGDPLAMRFLSGETEQGTHRLVFESDFRMPTVPKVE